MFPLERGMFLLFFLVLVGIIVWHATGRPGGRFLRDFATLLDRPEFVDGLGNRLMNRAFLKGEFRGRKIVILIQQQRRQLAHTVVVSMETRAAAMLEPFNFTGDRVDREGETALFALEVKHQLRLRHEDGCLKARWRGSWPNAFGFLDLFDEPKWRSILEAMHTLAGSLERREVHRVA